MQHKWYPFLPAFSLLIPCFLGADVYEQIQELYQQDGPYLLLQAGDQPKALLDFPRWSIAELIRKPGQRFNYILVSE